MTTDIGKIMVKGSDHTCLLPNHFALNIFDIHSSMNLSCTGSKISSTAAPPKMCSSLGMAYKMSLSQPLFVFIFFFFVY